ncbi:hypothetical protein L249_5109 [Ophiocordyceps polyrhachis-furcata BCC 54312]|uniref:Uncharacterized protein n=1 Tax=Ophiocordyceps polyrhachis-furcata BCC 54312 TaxID=1330021 RepID=A0A367L4D2_9HYPO|nr:hypothetical protein L249_5109 [Ophiocordyceps polyrhachis-furcata BCC 54312]
MQATATNIQPNCQIRMVTHQARAKQVHVAPEQVIWLHRTAVGNPAQAANPPKAENPGFWKGIGASASQGFGGNLGFGVSNLVTGGLGYAMGSAMSGKSKPSDAASESRATQGRQPTQQLQATQATQVTQESEATQATRAMQEPQKPQRGKQQIWLERKMAFKRKTSVTTGSEPTTRLGDSEELDTKEKASNTTEALSREQADQAPTSTSESRPGYSQHLPWTSPEGGEHYCKRQGWYEENGRFLADEEDTTKWKSSKGVSFNWSAPVVEDCRWEGSPPFCGTADEYTGAVVDGWKLIIGDRIRKKAICKKPFSRYYSGQDCCRKFDARNKCRRGYRRLWCKTKNPWDYEES